MTDGEFYGDALWGLKDAEKYLLELVGQYLDRAAIVSCLSRIKTAQSMIEKLERQGLDKNLQ